MNRIKKLCLLILLLFAAVLPLTACRQATESVTVTFTVDGRIHREYVIGRGQGLADVPDVPEKKGYLAAWSVWEFSEFHKDTTVTAVYTKNFFKITFKSGSLILRTVNVTIGENPTSFPEIPPKEGYASSWDITDFTIYTMDTVANAVYTPMIFDITFVVEDGDDIVRQVPYGGTLTDIPDVPPRTGLSGAWELSDFTDIKEDMTVEAVYLPKIVKVTFDDEGELTERNLEYNQPLSLPYDLTKADKIFGGWYYDVDFDDRAADFFALNDITLYAFWIEINSAAAASAALFVFTETDGGYAIKAAPGKTLPKNLVLPNSYEGALVTRIDAAAFKDNTDIESVTLPIGITVIGDEAFYGCSELSEVVFADKNRLIEIGASAFYAASTLESISLPKTVETIGAYAFYNCHELSTLTLAQGSSLKIVEEYSFYGCRNLRSVRLPQSIIKIGGFAFASLYNTEFVFEGLDRFETLGRFAFQNCSALYSFNAPNVISIGDGAFAGCGALTAITVLGDTPINDYFGDEPYVGTAGSYNVTQIIKQRNAGGEYVLDSEGEPVYLNATRRLPVNLSTVTVRSGCADIVDNFLNNCVSVNNINIPASVRRIGRYAFAASQGDGSNLMKSGALTIASGSRLEEIDDSAFLRRTSFAAISFPSSLKRIGNEAFRAATNLEDIRFADPSALQYIGRDAFTNSEWMRAQPNGIVYLAGFALAYKGTTLVSSINLTEWHAGTSAVAPYAFWNIAEIRNVVIPSFIKTVFESAFASSGMTSLDIKEGVERIGDDAFKDCVWLANASLPASAQALGRNILSGCYNLTSLNVCGDRIAGEYFGITEYLGGYAAEQTPNRTLGIAVESGDKYIVRWNGVKDLYGGYPESYKLTVNGAVDADGNDISGYVLASMAHDISFSDFYEIDEDGVYEFFLGFTPVPAAGNAYTSDYGYTFYLEDGVSLNDALCVKAHFRRTYYAPLSLRKLVIKSGAADGAVAAFGFMNFSSIQELSLSDGIEAIGEAAFLNCAALGIRYEDGEPVVVPLDMPFSLRRIEKDAFKNCVLLSELELGRTEYIGGGAFECSGLTDILIPETAGFIGASAFADTPNLSSVRFADSALETDAEGAVLNALIISDAAFSYCRSLLNINIPDRVTVIGVGAFSHNRDLDAVVFGNNSRLNSLGEGAFAYNPMMTVLALPPEIDLGAQEGLLAGGGALRDLTLYNLSGAQTTLGKLFGGESFTGGGEVVQDGTRYYIPVSLTSIKFLGGSIPDYMFQNINAVKIVTLENVTAIGRSAFENCLGIEKIDFPQALEVVGASAFSGCASLSAANLPEDSALSAVGEAAFMSSGITQFYFPDGVTEIEADTFNNCAALENISISRVTSIGRAAFYGCVLLNELNFSENLEHIGDYAFYNCSSAEIPFKKFDALLTIGNFAFYNCVGLTAIQAENIEKTGIKAYSGAYNLREVTVPGNTLLGSVFGGAYYENSYEAQQNGTYYIPAGLFKVRISSAALALPALFLNGCSSVEDVVFYSDTPPSAESGSFNGTSPSLKLFVPVASVQSYKDSYTFLADSVYSHPSAYEKLEFVLKNGVYAVRAAFGADLGAVLYLPSVYNGIAVAEVLSGGFEGHAIKELIVPAGIKIIGEAAFKSCADLERVSFEGGSRLEVINNDAFFGCVKLKAIIIPRTVRIIGDYAFAGLRTVDGGGYIYSGALSSVVFEKGGVLESIGKYAFYLTKCLETIEIPSTVTALGRAAFSGSGLKSAAFAAGSLLTVLPADCFADCESLWQIDITGIEIISQSAFKNCGSLTSVQTGAGLRSIGERAFYSVSALKQLSLPSSLEYIGGESFRFCSALESFSLPEGLTYLGDYAFGGAVSLFEVTWPQNVIAYIGEHAFMDTPWLAKTQSEADGVVYINNVAYTYIGEMPAATVLTLRNGTTAVSPRAFENQTNLTGIIIPSTVKTVGDKAFYNCPLVSVVFDGISELSAIGGYAFYGARLTEPALPESVRDIGAYAFYHNDELAALSLPLGLLTIGEGAFMELPSLTADITLPDSVTSIGAYAFYGTPVSLTVTGDSALTSIGVKAFSGTASLDIVIPSGVTVLNDAFSETLMSGLLIPSWVTELTDGAFKNSTIGEITVDGGGLIRIGARAFYGLTGTAFALNDLSSLKIIGAEAFHNCALLGAVNASGISSIGQSAFHGCVSLTELTTNGGAITALFGGAPPESLTAIGIAAGTVEIAESAFEGAAHIVSVYLPATLKRISRYAFRGAAALKTIVFEIEETLASVGKDALLGTMWLDERPAGVVYLGKIACAFKGGGAAAIKSGTTAVAEYAFYNNAALTSVSVPVETVSIGEMAFAECTGLSSFTLAGGSALRSIGSRAFMNCSALTSFAMPFGVAEIGAEAFSGCASLASLNYGGIVKLGELFGTAVYAGSYAAVQDGTEYRLPAALKNVRIVDNSIRVADYCMQNVVSLTSVILAVSVSEAGAYAFDGCSGLTQLTIVRGSRLERIGDYAFKGCSGISTLYLPDGADDIGLDILSGACSLTELTVGGAHTAMELFGKTEYDGGYAVVISGETYFLPASLKDIIIADGGTEIAPYAYAYSRIENVEVATSVEIIGEGAFRNADRLEVILVPSENSLKEIAAYAFYECETITSVTIYSGIKEIGEKAFYGCLSLVEVNMLSGDCRIGAQAFHNTPWYSDSPREPVYAGNTLLGYVGMMPEDYNLIIREGTTDIAANAFESQSGLSRVSLPSSVNTIGAAAFMNCLNLKDIVFLGEPQIEELPPKLFYNCTKLESFPLPASVKKVGEQAFYRCTAFQEVEFGGEATEIGDGAFNLCGAVTVTLPASVKIIGNQAFAGCLALELLTVAEGCSLETIGEAAFDGDKNTVFALPVLYCLKEIGARAFNSCELLSGIDAPALEIVGQEAFRNCISLAAITMTGNTTVFELFGYADNDVFGTLYDTVSYGGEPYSIPKSLTAVNIAYGAETVPDYAFYGCPSIEYVFLPDTVKSLGVSAFENCSSLESAVGGALESIGAYAFKNCVALSAFDLPFTIKTVGAHAFENCVGLTAVTLAENSMLSTIGGGAFKNVLNAVFSFNDIILPVAVGAEAFKNCVGLSRFIAENVISYGDAAFGGCSGLTAVSVVTQGFIGRLFGTESYDGGYAVSAGGADYYIPQTLTHIYVSQSMNAVADYAFADISTLEYVWLNGVSAVGKHAFRGLNALTEIVIPASVVVIDDFAFEDCGDLSAVEVELADTLTYIGEGAFDDTLWYADLISGASGTVFIGKVACAYIGVHSGALTLPEGTVGIAPKTFMNQTGITEISLPLSLSVIGRDAFRNCGSVERIYTAGNFELGRLFGETPFASSYAAAQGGVTYYIPLSLKRIIVTEGAAQLADGAFAGCYSLTHVTLPLSLYNVGSEALRGCAGITTLTAPAKYSPGLFFGTHPYDNSYAAEQNGALYYIPNALKTINALGSYVAEEAYKNFVSLTTVNIPVTVTQILSRAFYGCLAVTELNLHAGITSIGGYAFAECTGITAINLPSQAVLGEGILNGCNRISSLTVKGDFPLHELFGTLSFIDSYEVRHANKSYYIPAALVTVAIKDVSAVADTCMEGFSSVSTLTLPDNITNIGRYAFAGMTSLNAVLLPQTLTEVGEYAFTGDISAVFSFATNNISIIGRNAFQNCYMLTAFNTDRIQVVGIEAFSGCYGLSSLSVKPGRVLGEYFGKQMFINSYAAVQNTDGGDTVYYIPNALSSVTIYGGPSPYMLANLTALKSVVLVGEASVPLTAFIGCTGITSLTGPDIVFIEKDALLPLPWLTSYIASRPNNSLVYIGKVAYMFKGSAGIGAVISLSADTAQVYAEAFKNQSRLTRVDISAGVRQIDLSAFDGCTGLVYIGVDEGNAYYSAINGMLYNKAGDTLIYRPLGAA